jgi:hypothetical protein
VRTVDTVSSQDRVGKKFAAQLDKDVVVNGTVLLRAGTKVVGKVETSRALAGPQSGPLALNLAAVSSRGREISIVTTGVYQPERRKGTRRSCLGNEQQVRASTWVDDAVSAGSTGQSMTEKLSE